jgi:hypothetical protein
VRKVVILLDDANRWATADDLQELAKVISKQDLIRLLATWTFDDSGDAAKLVISDLPKMTLLWEDLKPAVVRSLLKYEGDVVAALQKYEGDRFGSLGMGILNTSLTHRIEMQEDRPQTVYEFIFGLRGDEIATADAFRRLFADGRSDIPVMATAIKQIADFETPISVDEVMEVCGLVTQPQGLPAATPGWIRGVFHRQIEERRILRVRDHFTTIHRKWASKFIAAGLSMAPPDKTTHELVKRCFTLLPEHPERLLRLWSWLRALKESRPFTRKWEASLSEADWTELVRICAAKGIIELGGVSQAMHLLKDDPSWDATVRTAFTANEAMIKALIHGTTSETLYWLKELSYPIQHAAPELWTRVLVSWDRKSVANLLASLRPEQFEEAWSALGKALELAPQWLPEVGAHVQWSGMERILMSADPGDAESVCKTFGCLRFLWPKIKRSQLRVYGAALAASLQNADLGNLRISVNDANFLFLSWYFPEEAKSVVNALDAKKLGEQLSVSLPREWRKLIELSFWLSACESDLAQRITQNCDRPKLLGQCRKYAPANPYEFRTLLHFLANGSVDFRLAFAKDAKEIVRLACEPRDGESKSILGAFSRLDSEAASEMAKELGLALDVPKTETNDFSPSRARYQVLDAKGEDYDLDF